jgi:hypothetical protein
MRQAEPPRLAAWMLEHCASAEHADALTGDLLEDFRAGRTDGWYWRQTLSACAVSWAEGLRARTSMVLFALVWSMLAPAWKAFIDGIDSTPGLDRIWPFLGPFWVLVALAGWIVLHSIFLWTGILVYYVANTSLGSVFRPKRLTRALLLAPLVFAPVYGALFLWADLYWYSFFANAKLATTTLGQIADLQMLANMLRMPFLIALVCAIWNLVPQATPASHSLAGELPGIGDSSEAEYLTLPPHVLRRFIAFMVGAGLINAMIASFILCRLPAAHAPTLQAVLTRAILFVGVGAFGGILGTYLYWHSPNSPFRADAPLPFPLFALVCSAGWVWVPAMAMFSEQLSGATAVVAGVGAFFLAIGLRQTTFSVLGGAKEEEPVVAHKASELFAGSLYRPRGEMHGHLIAVSLSAGFVALAAHENLTAAALLACSAFVFAWKRTFVSCDKPVKGYRQSAYRLGMVIVPAVLVTAWALLDGVAHRNRVEAAAALAADEPTRAHDDASDPVDPKSSATGAGGFESLILWPYPERKPIVAPVRLRSSFLARGSTQPLIIRFDGAYWYLQPPDKRPGLRAHQAQGTPLSAEIRSINDLPLVMDAHQPLGASIPIARCGKIQVEIESRDSRAGSIEMAVLLTDGSMPGRPEVYLGQKEIRSSYAEPNGIGDAVAGGASAGMKPAPTVETLEFAIPAIAKIRQFNEITVMLLADSESAHVGPKIAVRQFQIFPR